MLIPLQEKNGPRQNMTLLQRRARLKRFNQRSQLYFYLLSSNFNPARFLNGSDCTCGGPSGILTCAVEAAEII